MMTKAKPLPPLQLLEQLLDYDPKTGVFTWKVSSGRAKAGSPAGTRNKRAGKTTKDYLRIKISGRNLHAHRLAYFMQTKIDPLDHLVDHVNGDGLDNVFTNLRLASKSQNAANSGARATNRSSYKGVSQNRSNWQARICLDGKRKHLGTYPTPELAHVAYRKAAAELFGDFARVA
jgi:hypothetical protein